MEKVQTQGDQPEWKQWHLYANFLLRELVRMWYGQKSIFGIDEILDLESSFWRRLGHTFGWAVISFGEENGLTKAEITKRIERLQEQIRSDATPNFCGPVHELFYFVKQILGDELAQKFLYDIVVGMIFGLIMGAYCYAAEGKLPPYKRQGLIPPLEFCENLPVAPDMEKLYYGKNTSQNS